jgi:hypothetical protein
MGKIRLNDGDPGLSPEKRKQHYPLSNTLLHEIIAMLAVDLKVWMCKNACGRRGSI